MDIIILPNAKKIQTSFEQSNSFSTIRYQQSVDNESRSILTGDAGLADGLAPRHHGLVRPFRGLCAADNFQKTHYWYWVEEM